MARAGRQAELAVEALKRLLNDEPSASIESPGYLIDQATGQQREFDVLVTEESGIETVEVRDRNTVVGVEEVEAFVTKVGDTKANKAIIVSTRGFGGPALKKANRHGITCFKLQRSDTNQFGRSPKLDVRMAKPASDGKYKIEYFIGELTKQEIVPESHVKTENGKTVDVQQILNSALALINKNEGQRLTRSGRATAIVPLQGGNLRARCNNNDTVQAVTKIKVHIDLDIIVESYSPVVYGLYTTDDDNNSPVVEMPVYPELSKTLGLKNGFLGFGTKPGGPLMLLKMREPEK